MKRRKNEQTVPITTEQANMLRSLVANLMGVAIPCSQCKQPDAAKHTAASRERAPGMGHPGTSIPSGLQRLVPHVGSAPGSRRLSSKSTTRACCAGGNEAVCTWNQFPGRPSPHAPSLENSGVRASAPRRPPVLHLSARDATSPTAKSAGQRHVRYSVVYGCLQHPLPTQRCAHGLTPSLLSVPCTQ